MCDVLTIALQSDCSGMSGHLCGVVPSLLRTLYANISTIGKSGSNRTLCTVISRDDLVRFRFSEDVKHKHHGRLGTD